MGVLSNLVEESIQGKTFHGFGQTIIISSIIQNLSHSWTLSRESGTKGGFMKKKAFFCMAVIGSILLIFTIGNSRAELKVGDVAPGFVLATTQDKPVDYISDYYGKYHLVLEFFPNAFGGG
jgi:hypothetical protein